MLHEEYALLSLQTELVREKKLVGHSDNSLYYYIANKFNVEIYAGTTMSYTALMQQVIQSQSPKINLHTNQVTRSKS